MAFEISNLYEQWVIDEIMRRYSDDTTFDHGDLEDMACVALNHLPPKYYRHGVDLLFYMSPEERSALEASIQEAITAAHLKVGARYRA